MAGATNRALKAAGIPKATIQTLRVESGGRLSLRSAIGMAHERKLPTRSSWARAAMVPIWARDVQIMVLS